VEKAALSPDGNSIAFASAGNNVALWDMQLNQTLGQFVGHTDSVTAIVFAPNGRWIASGSKDSTLHLWNVETRKLLYKFEGHTEEVNTVGVSANSSYIASSTDNSICIWDVETQKQLCILNGHTGQVQVVAFSPDSKSIASGSWDGTVCVWDVETGNLLQVFQGHNSGIFSVAFSPNGRWIASGSFDTTVRVWDTSIEICSDSVVSDSFESGQSSGHDGWVSAAAFCPNNKYIVSGGGDTNICTWNAKTGKMIHMFEGHTGWVTSVSISPDGKYIASGSADNTILLWDGETAGKVGQFGENYDVQSLAFSHNGKHIIFNSRSTICMLDVQTGEILPVIKDNFQLISDMGVSPDGQFIVVVGDKDTTDIHPATGHDVHTVHLWDVQQGELSELVGHTDTVQCVAFSHDGKKIVSGSADKTVHVWDPHTKKIFCMFEGHTDCVRSVAFSPDGEYIVSTSHDTTVRVWDVGTRAVHKIFRGHTGWVRTVGFSPDGKHIVSGSHDNTLRVWETENPDISLLPRVSFFFVFHVVLLLTFAVPPSQIIFPSTQLADCTGMGVI
jgi:WD40 repeat protein